MYIDRKLKMIKTVFFLSLFTVMFLVAFHVERHSCMGIPLIKENELKNYTEDFVINIEELRFNNEKIAADIKDNLIFISQSKENLKHSFLLEGILKSQNPRHKLFFLEDEVIEDLELAVQKGRTLSLIVISDMSMQKIEVALTTLPMVRLEGEVIGENERGREIFKGKIIVSAGKDPLTNSYSMKTSEVEWNIRGGSTSEMGKKSWKLSLKNKSGENNNLEFLGMGADDDWILKVTCQG